MTALHPGEIENNGAQASSCLRTGNQRYRAKVSYSAQTTDRRLMRAVTGGDEKATLMLIERHLPATLALARHMLGPADAEDIAQEAMFRLWRNANSIELDDRGVRPWLYRVTSNLCLDHLRRKRELTGIDVPERPIPAEQNRQIAERQMSETVEAAIAELPERQRLALALFHFEDLSQRDTAEIMEITEEALESLLRRARAGLKIALADNWKDLMPEPGE